MEKVERPKAEKRKINCKNEFELCYLRHQYLRRVDYNPTPEEMQPFMAIVTNLSQKTFFTYRNLFGSVGMESEDLISIGQVHLVSFLGLFALDRHPLKKELFADKLLRDKNWVATEADFLAKDKANLTMFLKQRFEDVVRICRQKSRNIRGALSDGFVAFYGPKKPPKVLSELLRDHEAHGYRKMEISAFKTIRKKADSAGANVFKFNDNYYVSVRENHKALSLIDFSGAGLDPHDSIHNMTPERIFAEQQDAEFWDNKRVEFDSYKPRRKTRMIRTFIDKYKDKENYAEEIRAAKSLLKAMEASA